MIPIIVGPTAVGKTELVLDLAKKLNGEVINLDSRQIYKYMNIGTAKPNVKELRRVKHHLIDFVDPKDHYSSFEYKSDFIKVYEEIKNRDKIPIVTGGTGFYLDSLIKPLIKVGSDYGLRNYLERIETQEKGSLRKILEKIDRKSFLKIHENDLKRIVRAIEIFILTGKNRNQLKDESKPVFKEYKIYALNRDRKELHKRINLRVEKMIEQGLVEEVQDLLNKGINEKLNSMNSIGYKEIIEYIKGKKSLEEAKEDIKTNTRNYARRQIIYFRKYKDIKWLDMTSNSKEKIIKFIINDLRGIKNAGKI
ncbi:MAG: tRNA dimethylallyltransferase [Geotoga sp.]|nr:tRNA dimethylallyltransferase [Geotoga sp.]